MTAVARQIAALELGAGRWHVDLALPPGAAARPHPANVSVTPLTAGAQARVESLAVPRAAARDRFSVVVAGGPGRFELSGEGWSARVALAPPEEPAPPAPRAVEAEPAAIDYRARDFDALRAMLLGVVDSRVGRGLSDHPVSETAALVEQLAYLGDALSYSQDAVATEAYLASARRRVSVARHAALLDYAVFAGRSARTWLRFEVSSPLTLPAGTRALAHAGTGRVAGVPPAAIVFETLHPVDLQPGEARHAVAESDGRLPAAATSATLSGDGAGLATGDLVLIEGADGAGQVVRLTEHRPAGATTWIGWAAEDALTAVLVAPVTVLAGNLVLADHGETHGWTALPRPVAGRRYWPRLPHPWPSMSIAVERERTAAALLTGDGAPPWPAVRLREGPERFARPWAQRESLLESGPLDQSFVVELEDDGSARLRFGDGVNGMAPPDDARFSVRMRSGAGAAGNVRAGALSAVVTENERVLGVRNVVAAVGGEEPEPLARVRLEAPRAFRFGVTAVTVDDYAAAARAVPGVADATAAISASGTGPVAVVRVFGGDWSADQLPLLARVHRHLEHRRPAGVALDVRAAVALPVTIGLVVAVQAGWTLPAVSGVVDRALRARLLGPGRFGFGTGLHRSDLVALLAGLPGVADVTLERFAWTSLPGPAHADLQPPFGHVIRIDDDPAAPEHGSVSFRLRTAP